MQKRTYHILFATIESFNAAFLPIGVYFLITTYRRKQNQQRPNQRNQHIWIINLALSQVFKNIPGLPSHTLELISDSTGVADNVYKWMRLFLHIIASSATYWYFLAIFCLTGDRLATVLFRYRISHRSIKIIIIATLCLCFGLNSSASVVFCFVYGWNWIMMGSELVGVKIQVFYVPTVLSMAFVFFACITYISMFVAYYKSGKHSERLSAERSMIQTFLNSKFYISILLITSFLILTVIPNLINSFCNPDPMSAHPVDLYIYTRLAMCLSDTVDNVIYILSYKPVRHKLKDSFTSVFHSLKNFGGSNSGGGLVTVPDIGVVVSSV